MKLLKNLLVLLILIAVFIYGILFAIYNEQHVALSLWSGSLVGLGIVIGLLVAVISKMTQSLENKRLKKEIKQIKAKFEKLNH